MLELEAGQPEELSGYADPETGRAPLGDIAISIERAGSQAEEYGHGIEREIAYLTVHSVLHLLGYDHMSDEDKTVMRRREELAMETLRLGR